MFLTPRGEGFYLLRRSRDSVFKLIYIGLKLRTKNGARTGGLPRGEGKAMNANLICWKTSHFWHKKSTFLGCGIRPGENKWPECDILKPKTKVVGVHVCWGGGWSVHQENGCWIRKSVCLLSAHFWGQSHMLSWENRWRISNLRIGDLDLSCSHLRISPRKIQGDFHFQCQGIVPVWQLSLGNKINDFNGSPNGVTVH